MFKPCQLSGVLLSVRRLPDDDRDISYLDYYVDESGEWDPWISRVPEAVYPGDQGLVDTVDTIRCCTETADRIYELKLRDPLVVVESDTMLFLFLQFTAGRILFC